MEKTFDELHRALTVPTFEERGKTVAGYCLDLLGWLATGFMLGLGMNIGQVFAG